MQICETYYGVPLYLNVTSLYLIFSAVIRIKCLVSVCEHKQHLLISKCLYKNSGLPYLVATTFNHPGSAASELVCRPRKLHLVLSTDLLGLPDKSLLCSSQPSGVSRLQIFVFTVLSVALWLRFMSFALGIWNMTGGESQPPAWTPGLFQSCQDSCMCL